MRPLTKQRDALAFFDLKYLAHCTSPKLAAQCLVASSVQLTGEGLS